MSERVLIEATYDALADDLAAMGLVESAETARLSVQHAPRGKGGTNWITRSKPGNTGQLPAYFQNVRNAIMRTGKTLSQATAITWGRIRAWAGGEGNVHPEVRAAARKAIAEVDRMRGKGGGATNKLKESALGEITIDDSRLGLELLEAFNPTQPRDRMGRWREVVGKIEKLPTGQTLKVSRSFHVTKLKDRGGRKYRVTMKTPARLPDQHVYADTAIDAADAALGVSPAEADRQVRAIRGGRLSEASSTAPPLSNARQRPGESLGAWGKRLQAGDAANAAAAKKTRSGKSSSGMASRSGSGFNALHPRGRGGQWTLKQGASGTQVRAAQSHLGVKTDGKYGAQTTAAVRQYQQKHGLQVDGVIGAQTLAQMNGHDGKKVKPGAAPAGSRIRKARKGTLMESPLDGLSTYTLDDVEVGDLSLLEAATDAEDRKDKGADEATEDLPSVKCPSCNKTGKPNAKGKCPNCGKGGILAVAKQAKKMKAGSSS